MIFAVYSGCDLNVQGKITSNDQVMFLPFISAGLYSALTLSVYRNEIE